MREHDALPSPGVASGLHAGHEPTSKAVAGVLRQDHERGVQLLVDLRELAQGRGTLADFQRRFADLRQRNAHRQGLMRRMNEAGLGTV